MDDICHLVESTTPHILILTETHLVSDQHHHLDKLRTHLTDYSLYMSSIPRKQLPPSTNKHYTRQRKHSLYAPAGVLLALHRSIAKPHMVQVQELPYGLRGYMAHVTVGSAEHQRMHIIGAYSTPSDPEVSSKLLKHLPLP